MLDEVLKKHLEGYKVNNLGIEEKGIYIHKGKRLLKGHILPKDKSHLNILNPYQPFVQRLLYVMHQMTEPVLSRIRRYCPKIGIDISPIILLILIELSKNMLVEYFYV